MTLRDFETDLARHGLELQNEEFSGYYVILDAKGKFAASPTGTLDRLESWWKTMKERIHADYAVELQARKCNYTKAPNTRITDPPTQDYITLDAIFCINRKSVSGPLATASILHDYTGMSYDTITQILKRLHTLCAIAYNRNLDSKAPGRSRTIELTQRGQYLLYYHIVTPKA